LIQVTSTGREKAIPGALKLVIPGAFRFASDLHAGGNAYRWRIFRCARDKKNYRWRIWMAAPGITFYPWRTSKSASGIKFWKFQKKSKKSKKVQNILKL
jgi:hypothetical protein